MDEVREILLNSSNSKASVNMDTKIDIDLENDVKKFPVDSANNVIDQYRRYVIENDASNKYRFVFTINPVCSNVLYNHITEIVENEGSDDCKFFGSKGTILGNNNYNTYKYGSNTQTLTRGDLISDTGYSHKELGKLTYHCGVDIFNNHRLRSNEFVVVTQLGTKSADRAYFNTIKDYVREIDGSNIKIPTGTETDESKMANTHLYYRSTIDDFETTINEKLIERNGWFGFINQTGLDVPNVSVGSKKYTVNKCMNGNKPCEFIDLYPDRSLFSFLPKINNFRKREEYNWDYCITYPYKNYSDNELVSLRNKLTHEEYFNGMLSEFSDGYGKRIYDDIDSIIGDENDTEYKNVFIYTMTKNNISDDDYVKLCFVGKTNNGVTKYVECLENIKVRSIGLNGYNLSYFFSVNLGDVISDLKNLRNECGGTVKDLKCYVARIVDGRKCKYYFRKFKRLPNFKNTDVDTSNGLTDETINDNCLNNFNSSLNKLGFGLNVYGDRMAQIVYDDDINTYGLTDNLGRDLHEVFLTIIKTNRGHEKWYNETLSDKARFCDDSIEYSHCFSKVTSGIDMPWVSSEHNEDYNVHKIHNMFTNSRGESTKFNDKTTKLYPHSVEPLEDNITCSGSTTFSDEVGVFLGDIVEFDELNVEESVLETVCHRFNTEQRETLINDFSGITETKIITDDYDAEGFATEDVSYTGTYRANLAPEGYYYKAHYRIQIREFSDVVNEGQHTKVTLSSVSTKSGPYYHIIKCTTDKNYYFQACDKIIIYNKNRNEKFIGEIISVSGSNFTNLEISVDNDLTITNRTLSNYVFYKPNSEKPYFAYDFDDGSGIYRWRLIESCENIKSDSEIYDSVFTNGAHYYHKQINFFLRRQDPYCDYKLNDACIDNGYNLGQYGNEKDITQAEHFEEGGTTLC